MYGSDVDYIVFFQLFSVYVNCYSKTENTMGEYKTHIVRMNGILHRGKMVCIQYVNSRLSTLTKKMTLLLLQKYFIQSMPVHKWPYYNSSKQKCYRKFYFDCESFTFLMIKNKLFFVSKFCVLFFARAKFGIYRSICIYH